MDLALINPPQEDAEYERILRDLHQLEWNSSRKYDRERDEEMQNLRKEILLLKELNKKNLAEKNLEIAQNKIEWQKREIKLLEEEDKTLKFVNRQVKPLLLCYMNNEIERLDQTREDMQEFYNKTMERMQKELNRVLNFIENTFTKEEIKLVHKFLDNFEKIYNDHIDGASSGMLSKESESQTNLVIAEQSDEIQIERHAQSKPMLTTIIEVVASQDKPMVEENITERKNLENEFVVKKTRFDPNISYQDDPSNSGQYFDKDSSKEEEKLMSKPVKTKSGGNTIKSDPGIIGRISNATKSIFSKMAKPSFSKTIEPKFANNMNNDLKSFTTESFNFDRTQSTVITPTKPMKTTTTPHEESMLYNTKSEEEKKPEAISADFFTTSPLNNTLQNPVNKSEDNFAFMFAASPEGENQASPGDTFQFNFNPTGEQENANESLKFNFF